MSFDENVDSVYQLGEGIPPYNFELFSDIWPRNAPKNKDHDGSETEAADTYSDEDVNGAFDGPGNFFGPTATNEDPDDLPGGHHNSFENDPVVPDYDFDLFSDVTNRWSPPDATYGETSEAGNGNGDEPNANSLRETGKENIPKRSRQTSLVLRGKPHTRKASTLEVEEYAGTDDDALSVASSNYGKRGNRSLVSTTQRLVDCEVISNPDDSDARSTRPRLRCR